MDAEGHRAYSVRWDDQGKAFGGHLGSTGERMFLAEGRCSETGQVLACGGSREARVSRAEGARRRAAGDEVRGGGAHIVQSRRDRYVCFGFKLGFEEPLEGLEPKSDIRCTF